METTISNIDLGIVVAYFMVVLVIGLWVASKTKTGDDLFLGGRSLTWGFIGLSLFASNISSSTIIGLAGAAYSTGISQSVYEWMTGIPLIIGALIFIPLYLRARITTIPEYLELRFDRRARVYFSMITVIFNLLVDVAAPLYAGAITLQLFFPEIGLWPMAMGLALIAGLYTALGGLKAVVYTDALQALILIIGCGTLAYKMFGDLGFSWDNVLAAVPEGHMSIVQPIDDASLPWPGLLLGVQLLGFWYWVTNQYIVQRVLGAKDIEHARWGAMLAGFLKVLPLFIMVIPGAMAIQLFPGLSNPDLVFPTALVNILPVGMIGLVLAGLIAAIMSSVDSTLNSASTLLVVDFIKPARPQITEAQVTRYGRIITLVLMVIAALWAPMIAQFGGIWAYIQQMFSVVVPPIAVLFLVGVFFKRGNAAGAIWTLFGGTAWSIATFLLAQVGLWNIHYTINVGITFAVSTAIFFIASYMTAPTDPEKVAAYTYHADLLKPSRSDLSWYQDYRVAASLLVAVMVVILVTLW